MGSNFVGWRIHHFRKNHNLIISLAQYVFYTKTYLILCARVTNSTSSSSIITRPIILPYVCLHYKIEFCFDHWQMKRLLSSRVKPLLCIPTKLSQYWPKLILTYTTLYAIAGVPEHMKMWRRVFTKFWGFFHKLSGKK